LQEKCLKNPANIRKKQSSSTNGAASQNSGAITYKSYISNIFITFLDQLYPNIQLDDTATIPCELCQEPIQWRHFEEHSVSSAINICSYRSLFNRKPVLNENKNECKTNQG
jgi:hypothetical protein